jgi:hypothetical protein
MPDATISLRRSAILSVFLITPLSLLVVFFDRNYFGSSLLPYMGLDSLLLPLYLLFFELPHILASFLGFGDKEYLRHYEKRLLIGIPLILGGTIAVAFYNFYAIVILYLILTMYHVMRQQTGVALVLGAPKNVTYALWSSVGVILGVLVYLALFAATLIPNGLLPYVVYGVPILFVCFSVIGVWYAYQSRGTGSWSYILLTVVTMLSSFYLLNLAYIFLAVFIMRFAHDVTAFLFYATHEYNRNSTRIRNPLYRFVPFMPYSALVAVPLFGIVLGVILREVSVTTTALFGITVVLGFVHYYLESFMWKRGSLHRGYVRVV